MQFCLLYYILLILFRHTSILSFSTFSVTKSILENYKTYTFFSSHLNVLIHKTAPQESIFFMQGKSGLTVREEANQFIKIS